jgi:hypothetical protein
MRRFCASRYLLPDSQADTSRRGAYHDRHKSRACRPVPHLTRRRRLSPESTEAYDTAGSPSLFVD